MCRSVQLLSMDFLEAVELMKRSIGNKLTSNEETSSNGMVKKPNCRKDSKGVHGVSTRIVVETICFDDLPTNFFGVLLSSLLKSFMGERLQSSSLFAVPEVQLRYFLQVNDIILCVI